MGGTGMAAEPPTAQGVSAILRAAGYARSETSSGRTRGQRRDSEGYQVRKQSGDRGVCVEHEPGGFSLRIGPNAAERRDKKLAEYAETLRARGWAVRRIETGTPCLLVTMKAED